jgi:hypothetical protein
MKPLTEKEFIELGEKAFKTIFIGDNPYGEPFQARITHRLLLFPFRWRLHDPWLAPIVKTMEIMNEDGFFVSALARPLPEEQIQPYHWYVPVAEAGEYGSVIFSQENAIYSVNGVWGIICSDEDHAIVGGPPLLIANIQESVTGMDSRIYEFMEMWNDSYQRDHVNIQWLWPMLSHIYGEENAKSILSHSDFKWLIE